MAMLACLWRRRKSSRNDWDGTPYTRFHLDTLRPSGSIATSRLEGRLSVSGPQGARGDFSGASHWQTSGFRIRWPN